MSQKSKMILLAVCMATAVIGLAFKANAFALSASQNLSFAGGSISGTLNGDLSNNILTLNASGSGSQLTIDTSAMWGGLSPPSTHHKQFSCAGVSDSHCVTVTTTPKTYPPFTVPAWQFDIGGVIDFNTGIATLTALPAVQKTIAEFDQISVPSFIVTANPNLGPVEKAIAQSFATTLEAALNHAGKQEHVKTMGDWNSAKTGPTTAQLSQLGSNVTIDLGLGLSDFLGTFTSLVDFTFDGSVANLIGSAFEQELELAYRNEIVAKLRSLINGLDVSQTGYAQDCSASGQSTIDVTCRISAQLSYIGTVAGPGPGPAPVAEPGTLALFSFGVVGVWIARRRKTAA